MAKEFDLKDKLRQLAQKSEQARRMLKEGIARNAEDACDVMVLAAREHTPHEGDGKKRGFNVITGELEAHWQAEFKREDGENTVGTVTLSNDMSYASYVQNGHKLTKHFVPWLYVDGMGTISYETNHNQPMFGMMVGTKTHYVDGKDMVNPAIDAFNESFDRMNEDLFEQLGEFFNIK